MEEKDMPQEAIPNNLSGAIQRQESKINSLRSAVEQLKEARHKLLSPIEYRDNVPSPQSELRADKPVADTFPEIINNYSDEIIYLISEIQLITEQIHEFVG